MPLCVMLTGYRSFCETRLNGYRNQLLIGTGNGNEW